VRISVALTAASEAEAMPILDKWADLIVKV